jgi:hypothetical protein
MNKTRAVKSWIKENRMSHTREPWRAQHHMGEEWVIVEAPTDQTVTRHLTQANARRIVACVNALEGVSLEAIENEGRTGSVMQALGIERDRLKTLLDATQEQYRKAHAELEAMHESDVNLQAERDRLLASNKELLQVLRDLVALDDAQLYDDHAGRFGGAFDPARAILSKVGRIA